MYFLDDGDNALFRIETTRRLCSVKGRVVAMDIDLGLYIVEWSMTGKTPLKCGVFDGEEVFKWFSH
jgi:hypothetical protein